MFEGIQVVGSTVGDVDGVKVGLNDVGNSEGKVVGINEGDCVIGL